MPGEVRGSLGGVVAVEAVTGDTKSLGPDEMVRKGNADMKNRT